MSLLKAAASMRLLFRGRVWLRITTYCSWRAAVFNDVIQRSRLNHDAISMKRNHEASAATSTELSRSVTKPQRHRECQTLAAIYLPCFKLGKK